MLDLHGRRRLARDMYAGPVRAPPVRGVAHFWNEVYIDGAWMTVDATAADPLRPAPVRFKLAQGPDTEIAGDRAAPAMKSLRIDITGSQKR